tara:strand:- start:71125 stop:72336 length:1212 start_codon:yes stop_codon:yes gene_type:complete
MLYNLGIYLYGGLIRLASLWNKKAKKWVEGRAGFWNQNLEIPNDRKVIWFHCASMGEYDQGLPVMQAFKEADPKNFILVTFFSPSGYEALISKSIGDHTCYLPLDTPRNAKKFIEKFHPTKAFFVKYEYWLNFIDACTKNGCKLYGLSALFRDDQRFFKWYAGRFKSMIKKFDHFFLQNETSASVLRSNGYENFTISGDTRYDRVILRAKEDRSNEIFEKWSRVDSKILVIGSSWPKDEQLLISLINKKQIEELVILAPHEVNTEHISSIEKQLSVPYQKYTDLENGVELKMDTQVIILNCIGVLAYAYKYGSIAYVGGAFGTGLHNILEPASFGLPVIFGPQHSKFPEADDFIEAGIGSSIQTSTELLSVYNRFKDSDFEEEVLSFMKRKSGATDEVMSYFK